VADQRIEGYARGFFEIARGEGQLERVENELLTIARTFETARELRSSLTDPQLPLDRKQGVIDQLLGGRAAALTVGLIQLLVSQNRVTDLPDIAIAVASVAAASREKELAEVRSAVPLDDATIERLTAALARATGKQVEVKVILDPAVIGGIVARVGDTVIDGSIAKRIDSVRQAVRSN
jgi:F-type H+-transporting ATPase subunit delta